MAAVPAHRHQRSTAVSPGAPSAGPEHCWLHGCKLTSIIRPLALPEVPLKQAVLTHTVQILALPCRPEATQQPVHVTLPGGTEY
jgi:hypothetical protein